MATVTGLNQILLKIKQLEAKKLKQLNKGIGQAALFLQRESQKIVPIDQGPLHASAFTRKAPGEWTKTTPTYITGYTAAYAIYVHEVPDPPVAHGESFNIKHADEIAAGKEHERGPNQQYKYLERPAREKRKDMVEIIRRAMR